MSVEVSREIASLLLRVGAVTVDVEHPFRYASGILSPIYCDNRLVISYPVERRVVADRLAELLDSLGGSDGADIVAGTATAGIPWAAWVAERLGRPMIYVRSAPKEHGRGQRIEGRLLPGQRAMVVEDLVTTGGSSLSSVEAIQEAGGIAAGVLAIFTYELESTRRSFAERGLELHALTGLSTLLEVAVAEGHLAPDRRAEVAEAIAQAFAGRE
jgi:orotate phosphoribosyltransferase